MKIGIIGAGGIAKAHAKAISTVKGAELSGFFDINLLTSRKIAFEYGGTAFESMQDLLSASSAVIISSPNFCHKEHALEALAAEKYVLCEKPMAVSMEEAEEMRNRAVRSAYIPIMGFNYRHLKFVQQLKEMLSKNELGDILSVKIDFKKNSALRRKKYTWRDHSTSNNTSGALGDLGVHLIDLILHLFNSPFKLDHLKVKMMTVVKEKEQKQVHVDDHSEVYGQLENKVFVKMVTSKCTKTEDCGFSIEVNGQNGVFYYHSSQGNEFLLRNGLTEQRVALPDNFLTDPQTEFYGWADSFRSQLIEWMKGIQDHNFARLATFEDGYQTQFYLNEFFAKGQQLSFSKQAN
ncbi:Gfo/Idh/MocA family oxidoreductase [Bacillus sp. WMMC1349]|uniref:Gfo/Idh/MocA family protein n=1 Tax=Bacillus sp. WMMC1349 TaxID=2736254 RepID=UPI001551829B|nr:Gfo/Idh/MocA family oxidoreductase [Bacillus sp. WMMC1349]NPC94173.1 Gfo/Idh/MocA family oxidoreductase [Bacillus sp. WMMC1349]